MEIDFGSIKEILKAHEGNYCVLSNSDNEVVEGYLCYKAFFDEEETQKGNIACNIFVDLKEKSLGRCPNLQRYSDSSARSSDLSVARIQMTPGLDKIVMMETLDYLKGEIKSDLYNISEKFGKELGLEVVYISL